MLLLDKRGVPVTGNPKEIAERAVAEKEMLRAFYPSVPAKVRAEGEGDSLVDDKLGDPIIAIINTADVDRHMSIVDPAGLKFENYELNPVVLWAHGDEGCGTMPIGKCVKITRDAGAVEASVVFDQADEFAKEVERKYRDGFLKGFSIGFIPTKYQFETPEGSNGEIIRYVEAELVEFSCVGVPSNPKALAKNLEGVQSQRLQDHLRALDGDKGWLSRTLAEVPPAEGVKLTKEAFLEGIKDPVAMAKLDLTAEEREWLSAWDSFKAMLVQQEIDAWVAEGRVVSADEFNGICDRRGFTAEQRTQIENALREAGLWPTEIEADSQAIQVGRALLDICGNAASAKFERIALSEGVEVIVTDAEAEAVKAFVAALAKPEAAAEPKPEEKRFPIEWEKPFALAAEMEAAGNDKVREAMAAITVRKGEAATFMLIHHHADSPVNWRALATSMGRILTKSMPLDAAQLDAVYEHLAEHYREAGVEPPPPGAKTPDQAYDLALEGRIALVDAAGYAWLFLEAVERDGKQIPSFQRVDDPKVMRLFTPPAAGRLTDHRKWGQRRAVEITRDEALLEEIAESKRQILEITRAGAKFSRETKQRIASLADGCETTAKAVRDHAKQLAGLAEELRSMVSDATDEETKGVGGGKSPDNKPAASAKHEEHDASAGTKRRKVA